MRTLHDIPALRGIPVLVRAALNVPVSNGKVANAFRLEKALPTIQYLAKEGAKVVVIGHIGEKGTETLMPVYEELKRRIPNLAWCPVATGPQARAAVRDMHPGDVLLLENLRRDRGEVGNDPAFAAKLAELADVFVEDSFDVCHRAHASVVLVPTLLPSYAGLLVEEEVRELGKALAPKSPSLAIIGGAKFSTKEPVIRKLLATYSQVHVGGALGNDIARARGYDVAKSLVSGGDAAELKRIAQNPKMVPLVDAVVAPPGSRRDEGRAVDIQHVPAGTAILDEGPQTVAELARLAVAARTVVWNGPLGNYEQGFVEGTHALARAIAVGKAHSIIGGGDTVAAIEALGLDRHFSFISTGGGAMLDFLAKGTLPGIDALG
jgi:phosphoglycerate kinase